jgi:hypothetical protein
MEELDEISRRELLIKARQAIEKDYQQAEADKKALDAQIEAKRKALGSIIERVEAAALQSDYELKRIAGETITERERIQAQNDALKIELAQLHAAKNKAESEFTATAVSLAEKLEERRNRLQDVSSRVLQEEAKLKACQESLALIKRTLGKADL